MKSEISSSPLSSHPHPFPIAICHRHWDFKVFLNYLSDIYWQLLTLQVIFWCPSCPVSAPEKLHCILVVWSTGERLATLGTSGGWVFSPWIPGSLTSAPPVEKRPSWRRLHGRQGGSTSKSMISNIIHVVFFWNVKCLLDTNIIQGWEHFFNWNKLMFF